MAEAGTVDVAQVRELLDRYGPRMKRQLRHCMHCSLCAESCFLYQQHGGDPQYMPSYKVLASLGELYRRRGRVGREGLETIKRVVWQRCALCTRCWCPVGVNIPEMIALARTVCRSQGVYPGSGTAPEQENWL